MGPGGNRASQTTQASPVLHVGSVGRVVLQTAHAVVKGCNKNVRVRVLFDAGSHRSFITKNAVQSAGLSVERQEWVKISTFGQGMKDSGLCDVYEIEVFPAPGGQGVKIEAYGVPSIAQIRKEHVEIEKCQFPYLQGLWFSDVNREMDVLEIDLVIWCFHKDRTIRGEAREHVAIETNLGWVLSGPLRGSDDESQVSVNLISHELSRNDGELEDSIRKLWDYGTLGIRQDNDVHEALKDAISFNGKTYKVCLPWKEQHGRLPSNYQNSLKRLRGQIERLRNDPDILHAYDAIIKEEAEVGIIERVPPMETEKSH